MTVDLEAGTATDGYGDASRAIPGETIHSVFAAIGSEFGDSLAGSNRVGELYGIGGDDTLMGRNGTDSLDGGDGTDSLDGGGGRQDTCTTGEAYKR